MKKQLTPWLIVAVLLTLSLFLYFSSTERDKSDLTPNWNYSSATGPNLYQQLANSFVFVIKRNAESDSWVKGDYGDGDFALFVVQRGNRKVTCTGYSAVSVNSSDIELEPFVGKAVLVTSFTESDELFGGINIERLDLDIAVNERLDEYRTACPTPFQKIDEAIGVSAM